MADQNWNYQELLSAIQKLPLDQRLMLMEELSRSMRREVLLEKKDISGSSLERVKGLLKPDGELPSDKDVSDAYSRFLIEKYT